MDAATVVVTGAGGNIGSNMIRALRDADTDYEVVGTEPDRYARYLSRADRVHEVPYADERDAYYEALTDVIDSEDADVLLPSNIFEIAALVDERDRFDVPLPLPDSEPTETFLNKWASYRAWRSADVAVPETVLLEAPADVSRAFDGLPTDEVWVRGAAIDDLAPPSGRAFSDPAAARCWVDYHDGWGAFTASRHLPGEDCTWLGVYDDGVLVAGQARKRLDYGESDTWGAGAPTVSKTVSRPDIAETGRAAIETIDGRPHGVFFADMRADSNGTLRVTEVNPGRLGTTSSGFYPRAGFNVPALLVDIALGVDYETRDPVSTLESDLHYLRKLDCGPVIVPGEEIDV